MKALAWVGAIVLALLAAGCGASADGDAKGGAGGALTIEQYLDLKTDALTSDKLDWKKAMEIALARAKEEPDAGKTYVLNMPVQWFNAEHDVYIYAYRRQDDRTIQKGAPSRGFAVILNATTGEVKLAGAYQR